MKMWTWICSCCQNQLSQMLTQVQQMQQQQQAATDGRPGPPQTFLS
jgi:hypothetical protein